MIAPTVISLFAGCGGSSLGYKLAGFRELLAVEWNDNAIETFRLNFQDVPIFHGDIAKLTGAECMRLAGVKTGQLDVLDSSPPCQGFSTAGKRKFTDPRNSLFIEFSRLLKQLQPRVFVMENVQGLVQGVMKQSYIAIIKTLRECGYRARGEIMNAMYFNVAQSRQRVIIIGIREDLRIDPTHPNPNSKPLAIRDVITPPAGTIGYITASNERHTLAGRLPLRLVNRPAPTLVKTGNSRMMAGKVIEKITLMEAARFASFPDEFKWRSDAIACIGNSVPPNLMRAIAEHIRAKILDDDGQTSKKVKLERSKTKTVAHERSGGLARAGVDDAQTKTALA